MGIVTALLSIAGFMALTSLAGMALGLVLIILDVAGDRAWKLLATAALLSMTVALVLSDKAILGVIMFFVALAVTYRKPKGG